MSDKVLSWITVVMGIILVFVALTKFGVRIDVPIIRDIQDKIGIDCGEECPACPDGQCPPNNDIVLDEIQLEPVNDAPPESPKSETKPDVTFYESYAVALEKAKQQDKPLFIVFHATWCGPCRQFKNTLDDPNVERALHPYIKARIDIDKDRGTARKYGARSIPHYVIASNTEAVNKKGIGYKNPSSFIAWLK